MSNIGGWGHSHRGTLPQGDTRFWFGLRLVLAVFFLVAAFLKWQAFVSGVPSAVSEVAPQLEWGLIQFEFLLAIWFLSGWATRVLWWVLVALFSIFTGAGLYQVWMGQSSCGCFGQYSLHPLWVVSLDVVILVLLLWSGSIFGVGQSRHNEDHAEIVRRKRQARLLFAVLAGGLLVGLLGMSLTPTLTNAMSEYAWPSWTGQYLVTSPSVADLGVGKPGEWRDFRVRVQNRAAKPIRLIGAANDCQCSAGQDLPVQVPAGGETVVRVRVKVGNSVGRRDGKIWIRTDHAAQPLLLCRWRGVVKD
jgi:uncharacterized membrane protein